MVRPSLGLIVAGEHSVHVEPRSLDVLTALAERADEVYPKKELIAAVWGDSFVQEEVVTHAIWDLRRALGDDANHPRFIQTIPRRGYRLIAPVEWIGREAPRKRAQPAAGGREDVRRHVAWAVLGVLLTLAALLLVSAPPGGEGSHRLVLAPAAAETPELAAELQAELAAALAGMPRAELIEARDCASAPLGGSSYCLTVSLESGQPDARVGLRVEGADGQIVWASSGLPLAADAGPSAAAALAKGHVAAFLEVLSSDAYRDPDVRPWFDFSRHDMRAISAFLEGIPYVFMNQTGGRMAIDRAARLDPEFAAPRIWRIPTLLNESDPEYQALLDVYLADLARIRFETALSPFERAMIHWALACSADRRDEQIKHLDAARKYEPENRPVRFLLAATKFETGVLEDAWELLEPLAAERWPFPGLYSVTAVTAILTGRVDAAQRYLKQATRRPHVDPETYELLALVALYRGEDREVDEYLKKKALRLKETGEPYVFDAAPVAQELARLAESEGRDLVARELREFAG